MNCFVIMPFAVDFDDVYALIKATVEGATERAQGRCFRLDEARPAGRITERLVAQLHAADLCIADITGLSPNVMWELGYAMALRKPTLAIIQGETSLPFDIHDLQSGKQYVPVRECEPLLENLYGALSSTLSRTPPISQVASRLPLRCTVMPI